MVVLGFGSPAPATRSIRPTTMASARKTLSCRSGPDTLPATPDASRLYGQGDLDRDFCGSAAAAAAASCVAAVGLKRVKQHRLRRRSSTLPTALHRQQITGPSVVRESAAVLADQLIASEDVLDFSRTKEQSQEPWRAGGALENPLRGRSWEHLAGDAWFSLRFSAVSAVFDWLDSFQDVDESVQWATELNGAFSPVSPTRAAPLTIKSGSLPLDLSGAFLRVGPNPAFWPPKKRTHVFDGDGMVHTVRIADGKATYNCAFMETERWKIEQQLGAEWFSRLGEFEGLSGLAKLVLTQLTSNKLTDLRVIEMSTANTAVVMTPENRLWALNESGLPFHFQLDEVGCPISLGFDTLEGTLQANMSAHPKFDHRTGETFFHGSSAASESPFYVSRSVNGIVTDRVELCVNQGFHHDLFITENYVVVVDGSMKFDPNSIVDGEPLWMFAPEQMLRFGLWPRSAGKMNADDFIWIESTEAAEIVHTLHAYDDEDGKVVLWAPVGREMKGSRSVVFGDIGPCQMHRVVIDVAAAAVGIQRVAGSELRTEFPRIRDDGIGNKVRYGYSALQGEGSCEFNFVGFAKWDFEAGGLARTIYFPEGVIGGEPIFVPSTASQQRDSDDNGYIGMFLWDSQNRESSFALYDARTMSPEPVVVMHVPMRVPMGFHGLWVTEGELEKQAAAGTEAV